MIFIGADTLRKKIFYRKENLFLKYKVIKVFPGAQAPERNIFNAALLRIQKRGAWIRL
jgi:hypothetical protein